MKLYELADETGASTAALTALCAQLGIDGSWAGADIGSDDLARLRVALRAAPVDPGAAPALAGAPVSVGSLPSPLAYAPPVDHNLTEQRASASLDGHARDAVRVAVATRSSWIRLGGTVVVLVGAAVLALWLRNLVDDSPKELLQHPIRATYDELALLAGAVAAAIGAVGCLARASFARTLSDGLPSHPHRDSATACRAVAAVVLVICLGVAAVAGVQAKRDYDDAKAAHDKAVDSGLLKD